MFWSHIVRQSRHVKSSIFKSCWWRVMYKSFAGKCSKGGFAPCLVWAKRNKQVLCYVKASLELSLYCAMPVLYVSSHVLFFLSPAWAVSGRFLSFWCFGGVWWVCAFLLLHCFLFCFFIIRVHQKTCSQWATTLPPTSLSTRQPPWMYPPAHYILCCGRPFLLIYTWPPKPP